jgi:hypothetical protein
MTFEDKIEKFCNITNANEGAAASYLEVNYV